MMTMEDPHLSVVHMQKEGLFDAVAEVLRSVFFMSEILLL